MLKSILLVALGGGIGSALRYLSDLLVNRYANSHFPVATFTVNIVGCFIIGLLFGFMEHKQLASDHFKYFFITGFCGGFTTFSTFAVENTGLIEGHHLLISAAYIAGSIITGLAAVWFGLYLTK